VNNNGPVFYVAGTQGGASMPRHFTVGAGTPLLFAVLNQMFIQYPVPVENELVADLYGGASNLNATINGVSVPDLISHAETSGVADLGLFDPNSLGGVEGPTANFIADPTTCPNFSQYVLCPAISAGYWLMVNLPLGEYTITTGGTENYTDPDLPQYGLGGPVGWTTTTTDIIDVVAPEPSSALMLLPAIFGLSFFRIWVNGRKTFT
jgi:hypothetical protein